MIWIRASCATGSASLRLQPTNTSILVVLPYPAIHKCVIQGLEMLQQPSDVANLPVPRTQTLQLRPRLAAHPETVQHRVASCPGIPPSGQRDFEFRREGSGAMAMVERWCTPQPARLVDLSVTWRDGTHTWVPTCKIPPPPATFVEISSTISSSATQSGTVSWIRRMTSQFRSDCSTNWSLLVLTSLKWMQPDRSRV